jgi:hypothetical protein
MYKDRRVLRNNGRRGHGGPSSTMLIAVGPEEYRIDARERRHNLMKRLQVNIVKLYCASDIKQIIMGFVCYPDAHMSLRIGPYHVRVGTSSIPL